MNQVTIGHLGTSTKPSLWLVRLMIGGIRETMPNLLVPAFKMYGLFHGMSQYLGGVFSIVVILLRATFFGHTAIQASMVLGCRMISSW